MLAGDQGGGCRALLHVKWSTATYVITEHPTCAAEHRCIWQCYMCSGTLLHMTALHVQQNTTAYGATYAAGQRYMCSGTLLHMAVHVQWNTTAYGSYMCSATCAVEQHCIWQCYICSGEVLHVQQNSAAYGSTTCAVEHRCIWQCMCSGPLHMAALHL